MKHLRKLFALLLALAFCCALLPVSAMADSIELELLSQSLQIGDTFTVSLIRVGGPGRKTYAQLSPYRLNSVQWDINPSGVITFDREIDDHYSYYANFTAVGEGTAEMTAEVVFHDENHLANVLFKIISATVNVNPGDSSYPPATPTDLGGSDEPDEVLYIGGMSGAGVAETKGGKPAESDAASTISAEQAQQAVILPEGAPAANPATGAAI